MPDLRAYSLFGLAVPIAILVMLTYYCPKFLQAAAAAEQPCLWHSCLRSIFAGYVTGYVFYTSFALEHIARAAASLPAARGPVWYSFRAGSRRAETSVHPLRRTASSY